METDPLTLQQAVDFIGSCKTKGEKILGVERLFLSDGSFVLDNTEIADFTMSPTNQRTSAMNAESALLFVKDIATENSYFLIAVE